MEPRACSDEHAAAEPLGSVVPVRGARVGGIVVVPIRAGRLRSEIDRYLGGCGARNAQHGRNQGSKGKEFPIARGFSYTGERRSEERRVGKECRSRWSP